jgi:hypothetical protein
MVQVKGKYRIKNALWQGASAGSAAVAKRRYPNP